MNPLTIVEVGPRDGLQNEATVLDVETRISLISRLVDAGARRIEAVSFVHPGRVPQMAGAEDVMTGVPREVGVSYSGLVLNERGLDRALGCDLDEINVVVVATETFSRKNQGIGLRDMLETTRRIVREVRAEGIFATVTIAAAFGCPFEGRVSAGEVQAIVGEVAQFGPDEIALADTIGVGVPTQVRELTAATTEVAPGTPLRFHFHNTRNTGYANAMAALESGITTLDAAVGGYGGCPFAPNATGNIGTEDLLYAALRSGYDPQQATEDLVDVATWLAQQLDKPTQTLLPRAGSFPTPVLTAPTAEEHR